MFKYKPCRTAQAILGITLLKYRLTIIEQSSGLKAYYPVIAASLASKNGGETLTIFRNEIHETVRYLVTQNQIIAERLRYRALH